MNVPPRIGTGPAGARRPRRRDHGYVRRSDRRAHGERANAPSPPRPPRGVLPLALVLLASGFFVGWIHVETKTRVLDLAERTARATERHTRLVERLRVLEAERAYLRRPDRIRDVAVGRLGLLPPPPEKVHEIVVHKEAP